MAYCSICGTKLNGQAVCPNCGTPAGREVAVAGNTSVVYGAPRSERQMALDEIDAVIEHFSYVEDDYNKYVQKTNELERRKHRVILSWMFSMPLWFIGFALVADNFPRTLQDILFLCTVILPIVLPIILKITNHKAIKKLEKQADARIQKVIRHYCSYEGECPVGFEYYGPATLPYIRNLIASGRANSVSQAINLMLDDIHKSNMEDGIGRAIAASETAASYAKSAASYSREAARNSRSAAYAASRW